MQLQVLLNDGAVNVDGKRPADESSFRSSVQTLLSRMLATNIDRTIFQETPAFAL